VHGERLSRIPASGEAIALDLHDLVFADEQVVNDQVTPPRAYSSVSSVAASPTAAVTY
jgi:hypothetical protein